MTKKTSNEEVSSPFNVSLLTLNWKVLMRIYDIKKWLILMTLLVMLSFIQPTEMVNDLLNLLPQSLKCIPFEGRG